MNNQIDSNEPVEVSSALARAAAVALLLKDAKVSVLASYANGRRPVFIVDSLPEGVRGVIKRSNPNGVGGTIVIEAAVFHDCQLEWMHNLAAVTPLQVVGHA